jgi:hypothetical protein
MPSAGFAVGSSFQAGRDIDGIAEEIVALNDDVAEVDADAETHLLAYRSIRVLLGYGVLHRDSAFHGVHSTGEVSDEAVTRRVEDPTAMRGDQAIDNNPVDRERAECPDLIEPHQATVALDIRREDCRELSLDVVRFQPRQGRRTMDAPYRG